ncbi:MAG: hypothetical protein NT069_00925, partial [Planctomycetota bacterium]|nr:hypothetical protein [Planctomycetota bacterium]
MSAVQNYTYRYPFESSLFDATSEPAMRWATSLDGTSDDLFFDGRLRRPALVGQCLSLLTEIVRTRFHQPANPRLLDPVVTSGGGLLRFEGFSSCCGVYARVDLNPDAFDVELRGKGTTNVDFNNTMRVALRRLDDRREARLQVGGTGITLTRDGDQIVERQVELPVRWIKGFCEVQAYQARLTPHFDLTPLEARDLLRTLPKGLTARQPVFLTRMGRALRFAACDQRGAVKIEGTDRLRILEPLVGSARAISVWYDESSQTNAWDFQFDVGRFIALLSPEVYRGFSGEGQILARLATGNWQEALPGVVDSLQWQSQIDVGRLAIQRGVSEPAIESALA